MNGNLLDALMEGATRYFENAMDPLRRRVAHLTLRVESTESALLSRDANMVGPPGPQGEPGEIGPMPRHEWRGTELRFEVEPGAWGRFVDLQGPKGEDARLPFVMGGGGGGTTAHRNSYFPSGW